MSKIIMIDKEKKNFDNILKILKWNLKNVDMEFISTEKEILERLEKEDIADLILIDIQMVEKNILKILTKIKKKEKWQNTPIIFLVEEEKIANNINIFKMSGVDYLKKPVEEFELLIRVENYINIRRLKEDVNIIAVNKMIELLISLEIGNVHNGVHTFSHIKRVREYSAILARNYGCVESVVEEIKTFSALHDVGKIALSKRILKKTDLYNQEEFEEMKEHVLLGKKIIEKLGLKKTAENIALYHHEKWDGTGYITGLQGKEIPLEARILALADAYDALGNEREYKPAINEAEIDRIILKEKGECFDPELVEVYLKSKEEFIEVKEKFSKKCENIF